MSIGELAAKFGLATHVLRHWESMGVLHPAGRASGRRRYGPAAVARVAMIVHCRGVGFSLPEIQAMLDAPDPASRHAVLAEKQAALARLEAEIAATHQMIDHALECPEHDIGQCPNFQVLVTRLTSEPGATLAAVAATHHATHHASHHANHHRAGQRTAGPSPRIDLPGHPPLDQGR